MKAGAEELGWFFDTVLPYLDERQRRIVTGATASLLGHGGMTKVAEAAGMSRNTVIRATNEVEEGVEPSDRQRAAGGGDRPVIDKQPGLLTALDDLVHPLTRLAVGSSTMAPVSGWPFARKIVEFHGGRIWLDTGPAPGTEICFTLPDTEGAM